jgi:hypothetical protein
VGVVAERRSMSSKTPGGHGSLLGGGSRGGQPYEATVAVPPRTRSTHHRETDTETVSVSFRFAPRRHSVEEIFYSTYRTVYLNLRIVCLSVLPRVGKRRGNILLDVPYRLPIFTYCRKIHRLPFTYIYVLSKDSPRAGDNTQHVRCRYARTFTSRTLSSLLPNE